MRSFALEQALSFDLLPARGWWRDLPRRWRSRRRVAGLLDLDDRALEDIGVTRAEVQAAARLPLGVDARVELEQNAWRRTRRMELDRAARRALALSGRG